MNKVTMKKFTTQEIRDLLDRVYREKISVSQMAEMLNEMVDQSEVSELKDGDFVVNMMGNVLIFKKKAEDRIYDHAFFDNVSGVSFVQSIPSYSPIRRHATEWEKERLIDALVKEGKRWNAEKLCVEDMLEEPKEGDLAIFWHFDKTQAVVRLFDNEQGGMFQDPLYVDNTGHWWANAIKFESKEQFEKLIKEEI